jgi:hypothetical protein
VIHADLEDFKSKMLEMNLAIVPVLDENYSLENDIPTLVNRAIGKSVLADIPREGIILRPLTEINDYRLGRVSFKSINPDFLLKFED